MFSVLAAAVAIPLAVRAAAVVVAGLAKSQMDDNATTITIMILTRTSKFSGGWFSFKPETWHCVFADFVPFSDLP